MTTSLSGYHYLWFFLPLLLLALTLFSVFKKQLGFHGKEDSKFYFRQFLYSLVAIPVGLVLDLCLFQKFMEVSGMTDLDSGVVRIMCYPAALLLMAYIAKFFFKSGTASSK